MRWNARAGSPKGTVLGDGLQAMAEELSLAEVMRLLERTARWVDPETFRRLPVWYPAHARGALSYTVNWLSPREIGGKRPREETNVMASKALDFALGIKDSPSDRPGWTCCHIWGSDQHRRNEGNLVVKDRRFYSCVGNMVLLPTPLKAFTDEMPEVKDMLRFCAWRLYSWMCDHESALVSAARVKAWSDWSAYPASWPREPGDPHPPGVIPFNRWIEEKIRQHKSVIAADLAQGVPAYPADKVREVLAYWNIQL